MARDLRARFILYMKGMAMGAADVVPGVSGGTIAFISGIYEELLGSIRSIGPDSLRVLRREGFLAAWRQMNGDFLLTLFAGIITSIILLVRPITWLLDHEPVLIWSFFFGLIAASIWVAGRTVGRWNVAPIIGFLSGAVVAYCIGIAQAGSGPEHIIYYFFAGAIAICAMILPGISGSFILLLLGAYGAVMTAIKTFDIPIILIFVSGCLVGLLSFSRLLKWMFEKHHDLTVASLSGFLLGSLTIVWPWKRVLSIRTVHEGRPDEHVVPFLTENVSPWKYQLGEFDPILGITERDPQLIGAIMLMVFGAVLLIALERYAPDRS